jgi:hypothetical protein
VVNYIVIEHTREITWKQHEISLLLCFRTTFLSSLIDSNPLFERKIFWLQHKGDFFKNPKVSVSFLNSEKVRAAVKEFKTRGNKEYAGKLM